MQQTEELIVNRFESILNNWICLHDEHLHFSDNARPQIKLCSKTLRIRANDQWSKLPKHIKEAMVAHELGHLEYQHYLDFDSNMFTRILSMAKGKITDKELQADRYACRLVGKEKYKQALEDYVRIYHGNTYSLGKVELELRIKQIG